MYAFNVCSTRLLEPVLDSENIYYDCSELVNSFTLQGKEAVVVHLKNLRKMERKRNMEFISVVVSDLYVQGALIGSIDVRRKEKTKVYIYDLKIT